MRKLSEACSAKAEMMQGDTCMVSVCLNVVSMQMFTARGGVVDGVLDVMVANEILRKIHSALYGDIVKELRGLFFGMMAKNDRESVEQIEKILTMIHDAEGRIEEVKLIQGEDVSSPE